MNKFWGKSAAFQTGGYQTNLCLLACCYAVGTIAGFLSYHFYGYAIPLKVLPQWPVFLQYVWYYAKYLLVAFVCGYTALGLLVQPVLLAARGYFMCSAVISAMIATTETSALQILSENMVISFVSLCCLFMLGSQGLRGARNAFSSLTRSRGPRVEPNFASMQMARFAICMVAIVIAGAINVLVAPYLTDIMLR